MPLPNPFDEIDERLTRIEQSLAELKSKMNLLVKYTPENGDELMNVKQAAKFLNIAVPTVYGLVCRSEIPNMKRNGKLYFYRSEILEYVRKGRRKTIDEIQEEVEKNVFMVRKRMTK